MNKAIVSRVLFSLASGAVLMFGAYRSAERWAVIANETVPHALVFQCITSLLWWGFCLYIIWGFFPMNDD